MIYSALWVASFLFLSWIGLTIVVVILTGVTRIAANVEQARTKEPVRPLNEQYTQINEEEHKKLCEQSWW